MRQIFVFILGFALLLQTSLFQILPKQGKRIQIYWWPIFQIPAILRPWQSMRQIFWMRIYMKLRQKIPKGKLLNAY